MEHIINGTKYEITQASLPEVYPAKGAGKPFNTRLRKLNNDTGYNE